MQVWHFDANGRFSRNALNQNGFSLKCQAQIFGQADNAAVLDSSFRLELERGYNRAGVNLRDTSLNVEL